MYSNYNIAKEDNYIRDRILWRTNYFWCGHTRDVYYNTSFVNSIEIIGGFYNKTNKNGDYHNGIAYIAKRAGVTKTQVKAIRKKFKIFGGYEFKTSCSFASILFEIIKALKSIPNIDEKLMEYSSGCFYRNVIAYEQYNAIRIAADVSMDMRIMDVATSLEQIQDTML